MLLPQMAGAQTSYTGKELVYHAFANARYAAHYKDTEYLEEDNNTYGTSGIDTYENVFANDYEGLYSELEGITSTSGTEVIVKNFDDDATITTTTINDGKAHIYKIAKWKTLTISGTLKVCGSSQLLILAADAYIYVTNSGKIQSGGNNSSEGIGNVCILGKDGHPALVHGDNSIYRSSETTPFVNAGAAMAFNYVKIYNFKIANTQSGVISNNSSLRGAQVRLFIANSEICNLEARGNVRAFIHDSGDTKNYANPSHNVYKSRIYLYGCNIHDNTKGFSTNTNVYGYNSAFISSGIIGGHHESSSPYRIKNCTFTNNKSNSLSGGVISWNTQTTNHTYVIGCTFTNNQSYNETSTGGTGGAISCRAPMVIKRCRFEGNYAKNGGGAIVVRCPSTGGTGTEVRDLIIGLEDKNTNGLNVVLELDAETEFVNNTTDGAGGAILVEARTATIYNTSKTFYYIVRKADLSLTIDGSTFERNYAAKGGGAIAMSLDYGTKDDPVVTYAQKTNSKDPEKVYRDYKTGIIIKGNTLIDGNHATENGGAIYMENVNGCDGHSNNGIQILKDGSNGTPILQNNYAVNGGAIYSNVGTGDFVVETGNFTNNYATENGGGVAISHGNISLKGGTFSGNYALKGGGLWTDGSGVCELYNALKLQENKIGKTEGGNYQASSEGSDLYTANSEAHYDLAENVNYGNICVQRGTAGHMIKLNGHSYNNYKARPDITLTGEGANGVLAVQDLEWVNVVNMIRDNQTENGGYSINPDSPANLLTDSRFTWTGDDATKTTTETYGMAYSRTDRLNRYGTVMLPFAATIMDNVTLYEIVSIEQGILSLHEVKEPERNKPYIYKIENADDENAATKNYSMHLATNKNTQLAKTELSTSDFKYFPDNSRYQFIGKYTLQEQIPTNGDYDIYYFKNDGTTSGFYHKSAGTITVNPYRGYITLKKGPASPAPPRMLVLSFDDEATGIGCMQVNMADIVRTEYFSTDGTRLAVPLSHGITIIRHHYSDGTSDTRKVRGI